MKKLLFLLGIGIIIFNLFYLNNVSQGTNLDNLLTLHSAQAEDPPPIYIKTTSNCSITLQGEVGTWITIFGVRYKFPTTGELSLTFNDVAVDCASGGEQMCSYYTCAMFWSDAGL